MTARRRIARRPAEAIGGGLVSLVSFVAYKAGADAETAAVAGVLAGGLPAAVTWFVDHGLPRWRGVGGARGLVRTFWRGTN